MRIPSSSLRILTGVLLAATSLAACDDGWNDKSDSATRMGIHQAPLSDGPSAANQPESDRYIVKFRRGRGAQGRSAVVANRGRIALEIRGSEALAAHLPAQALHALQNNPNVEYVEQDVPRYLLATGDTPTTGTEVSPYGIAMVQAEQVAWGGATRKVCIIDSGYQKSHEDLQDYNVTGFTDSGTGDAFTDKNGHGTHVAGTIAGLGGNGTGVVGVVGDGSLHLHIVKVFTADGWAYSSSLADAAQECADQGSHVISMSLGGSQKSRTEDRKFKSLNSAGILSIAAAGNDGNSRHSYPASYNSVMSVAAIDVNAQVADFSQYTNQVEIAAPGVAVTSTTPFINTAEITVGTGTQNGHVVEFSAQGSASGALADGDLCETSGSWDGKIVVCMRGNISFYDKVINAQDGGAVGVVIVNNEPGDLNATLSAGNTSDIPAIGLSPEAGDALYAALGSSATMTSESLFPANGYESWDGTSMATPHVSAVAALIWSHNASWTNDDIRNAMNATAVDLGAAGRDVYYGYGLVQAADALASLGGGNTEPPANESPTASFAYNCTELACTFDASGSSDSDGSIVSYSWSFGDSGATASHTFGSAGTYTVTLTVTDNEGATASSSQNVTVSTSDTGGGGDTQLVISNVRSARTKGRSFVITWSTSVPGDSTVSFDCCGDHSDTPLVTSHRMEFNGTKNATYTYMVRSTDANGNVIEAGPFTHRN